MLRRGFTLIELLVVVAIIALLVGLIFPVFFRAREAGRKVTCASNVCQLAQAWVMYAQDLRSTGNYGCSVGAASACFW
jgi:prepilin-type N-terminal cleavage/methylation domain-containing protein